MKFQDMKVIQLNPVKKSDKQLGWATQDQVVEARNPNISTLPKVNLPVKRG